MKKWLVTLAVIAFLPVTSARASSILIIGSGTNMVAFTYGSTSYPSAGGGSFDVSRLDGADLPWLYCVDLNHYISLSTTYSNALVRHDGMVNGSTVNNAANVAWLLDRYASEAAGNNTKEAALQGLIWEAIYGANFTFNPSSAQNEYYTPWLNAGFGTGDVSKYSWLTPDARCTPTAASSCYQGLVTYQPVPDGGATALLLGAAMAGLAAFRRRR
jgi:hypothetical protein